MANAEKYINNSLMKVNLIYIIKFTAIIIFL